MTNFSHCAPVGLPVVGDRPAGGRGGAEGGERERRVEGREGRGRGREGKVGGREGRGGGREGKVGGREGRGGGRGKGWRERGGRGRVGRRGGRGNSSPPVPTNSPSP